MVAARAGTAWINPVMTRPAPPMGYPMPMVAGQTDESIANQVTWPGPQPGYTEISLYVFPEYFTWDPNATVQTIDLTVYVPIQIDQGTWDSFIQGIHGTLLGMGDDMLMYEVDEEPLVQFAVPDQVCIPDPLGGSPFCIYPPGGGSTIQVGYAYRIWMLVGATPVPSGYRAAVRAQGAGLILAILSLITVLPIAIVDIRSLFNGTLTFGQAKETIGAIASAPGQAIGAAFQGPETTILILGFLSTALGVFAILHGMQPPPTSPVSLGGSISGPGGVGFGGSLSTGGGAPSGGRSRR